MKCGMVALALLPSLNELFEVLKIDELFLVTLDHLVI